MEKGDRRRFMVETPTGRVQVNLVRPMSNGGPVLDYDSALHGMATSETGFRSLVSGVSVDAVEWADPTTLAQRIANERQAEHSAGITKRTRKNPAAPPASRDDQLIELRKRESVLKALRECLG
jgi:hypothetical protein